MIEFGFPFAFLALPLPLIVWGLAPPRREVVEALRLPFFERVSAGLETGEGAVVLPRRRLQVVFVALLWLLAVTVVARPERLGDPIERTLAARDIMLAVDISGSMSTKDFAVANGTTVARLDGVKEVLDAFIANRKDDRIGLIVFGSMPYVLVPFTQDTAAARSLLATLQPGMAGQNTVLGDAIGLAIQSFAASKVDDRVLILLSDGADTSSRMAPAKAADIARQNKVTIYTIAVGNPDAENDDDRVDIAALTTIATAAGGNFSQATDEAGLSQIYAQIDAIGQRLGQTVSWRPRLPLTGVVAATFVALAMVGYAVEMLTSRIRHRRKVLG
ncbi:MAG: hypothetical protein DI533_07000 [Cereibacter sphaeroides]|uniref:VWFA domain-containing protein n=1 Tax=Cereibacter sphaeroides TaxID=1063 RepID=A0A2W5TW34_CERSP|nr:MAG: hypothetical protein DI533_07000 [Cereibacter sphaeroides]